MSSQRSARQPSIQNEKWEEESAEHSDGHDSTSNGQNNNKEKDTTPTMNSNAPENKPERNDIAQYVQCMKSKSLDISDAKMSGKQIKAAIDLAVPPNLNLKKHKEYFYVIQSESLKAIKEKYMNLDDSKDMTYDDKDDLITQFAKALKRLKKV